jgi:hypothetical protein
MPVRFLSDAELARMSGWPDEIADERACLAHTAAAQREERTSAIFAAAADGSSASCSSSPQDHR